MAGTLPLGIGVGSGGGGGGKPCVLLGVGDLGTLETVTSHCSVCGSEGSAATSSCKPIRSVPFIRCPVLTLTEQNHL